MKNVVNKIKETENIQLTANYYFLTEMKEGQGKKIKVIPSEKDGTVVVIGGFYKPVSKIKFSYG